MHARKFLQESIMHATRNMLLGTAIIDSCRNIIVHTNECAVKYKIYTDTTTTILRVVSIFSIFIGCIILLSCMGTENKLLLWCANVSLCPCKEFITGAPWTLWATFETSSWSIYVHLCPPLNSHLSSYVYYVSTSLCKYRRIYKASLWIINYRLHRCQTNYISVYGRHANTTS